MDKLITMSPSSLPARLVRAERVRALLSLTERKGSHLARAHHEPDQAQGVALAERVRTMYLTERKWPHMSEEEMMQHILASEERRRQQDLRMPAAQYELEKK
eukprot:1141380-Pelagomonas_calceolata.AAC.11